LHLLPSFAQPLPIFDQQVAVARSLGHGFDAEIALWKDDCGRRWIGRWAGRHASRQARKQAGGQRARQAESKAESEWWEIKCDLLHPWRW
jgi:hypothetical protein